MEGGSTIPPPRPHDLQPERVLMTSPVAPMPALAYSFDCGTWFTGHATPTTNHGWVLSMSEAEARRFARTLWHHWQPTSCFDQTTVPVWNDDQQLVLVSSDFPLDPSGIVGPTADGRFEIGGARFAWDTVTLVTDPIHPRGTLVGTEDYRVAHGGESGWMTPVPEGFDSRRTALSAASRTGGPARVVRTTSVRLWAPVDLELDAGDNVPPASYLPAWEDSGLYQTATEYQLVDLADPSRVLTSGTNYARLASARTDTTGLVLHSVRSEMTSTQLG